MLADATDAAGARAPDHARRDDPTIALLDAAATVLDVLTFYQERIANEGFLRTATERRSVLELARAIGYELGPGVAASTWLAFTLEDAEGSPETIGAARRDARPERARSRASCRRSSRPRPRSRRDPSSTRCARRTTEVAPQRQGDTVLYLQGTATELKPGDLVALVGVRRARADIRRVTGVAPAAADPLGVGPPAHTVVTLDRGLGEEDPPVEPPRGATALTAFRRRAALFGHVAMPWKDLPLPLRVGELHPESGAFIAGPYASRKRSWADAPFATDTTTLWLDQVHDGIAPGGAIVLAGPDHDELYDVTAVSEDVRNDFLLSGPTTRLEIDGEHIGRFSPKNAVVWVQSEELPLAERPRRTPIEGTAIELEAAVELEPGRLVAIYGVDADSGQPAAEVLTVATTAGAVLTLTTALAHRYLPLSVRVNANVAPATHGEAWSEVARRRRRPRAPTCASPSPIAR